jgi:hypothetical protein
MRADRGSRGSSRREALLFALALSGCGALITAVDGEVPDPGAPPGLRVEAVGGIAGMRIVSGIDSASRSAFWVNGPLCAPPGSCAPTDSLSGAVAAGVIDGLYARTSLPEFRALRADYGQTPNSADMFGYVVTIRGNGRTRTLQADDGSMPALLAQFVHDVSDAVTDVVRR